MPASIAKRLDCPACGGSHPVVTRDAGVDCIACEKVEPTGLMRYFPAAFVKVLGAGHFVDQIPARVEGAADKAARLATIEAELHKAEEQDAQAKKLSDLDARLADAEAKLAATKKGKE